MLALLDIPEVDIEKRQIENFQMIKPFFGEAANSPESLFDSMSEPAIITFYPDDMVSPMIWASGLKAFTKLDQLSVKILVQVIPDSDNSPRNAFAVFKLRFPKA